MDYSEIRIVIGFHAHIPFILIANFIKGKFGVIFNTASKGLKTLILIVSLSKKVNSSIKL